jgi:DNA-binding MarR family transcriptional regulator
MEFGRDEPLGRLLAVTGRLVRDRFDAALGQHGASLTTWVVLRTAGREDPPSQRELAHRMGIEGPTLVAHLDRMEDEGLVARRRDDRDRRVVRVALTARGRRRHDELREVAGKLDAELRGLLRADEIETLERVLPRIAAEWHPEATEEERRP